MKYTPSEKLAVFKKIIKEIEKGASLRSALKKNSPLSSSTFADWLNSDDEMAKRYARATVIRSEAIFEDILNIADENLSDTYVDSEGVTRTDHDVIQRAKLRVDARKWVLAKMRPTKYGDKLDVTTDNQAISLPPIVGMVIKNELNEPDATNELDQTDPTGYSDLF